MQERDMMGPLSKSARSRQKTDRRGEADPGSLLKKGTGSKRLPKDVTELTRREVPVSLFQRAARSFRLPRRTVPAETFSTKLPQEQERRTVTTQCPASKPIGLTRNFAKKSQEGCK
jgi:hypothetical protein